MIKMRASVLIYTTLGCLNISTWAFHIRLSIRCAVEMSRSTTTPLSCFIATLDNIEYGNARQVSLDRFGWFPSDRFGFMCPLDQIFVCKTCWCRFLRYVNSHGLMQVMLWWFKVNVKYHSVLTMEVVMHSWTRSFAFSCQLNVFIEFSGNSWKKLLYPL